MAAGFYLDRGSLYAKFRTQKNGRFVSLRFYSGIIIEDETQFTSGKVPSCTDQEIDKKIVSIRQAINDVTTENDPFKLNNETFTKQINEKLKARKLANKKADPFLSQTPFFTYADMFYQKLVAKKGYDNAKSINTAINLVRAYKPKLSFEEIDKDFDKGFLDYLEGLDLSKNYIAKMFGNLSRILNEATVDNVNSKLDYLQFKHEREEADNVYLNEEQLQAIYELRFDLSGDWKADFIKYTGWKEVKGWTEAQYKDSVQKCVKALENY